MDAKRIEATLKVQADKAEVELEGSRNRVRREQETHDKLWTLRRQFGIAGFVFVAFWQLAILGIVVLQGANSLHFTDAVLIALLSTTTANVIGLLVIVMKFVFAPLPPGE